MAELRPGDYLPNAHSHPVTEMPNAAQALSQTVRVDYMGRIVHDPHDRAPGGYCRRCGATSDQLADGMAPECDPLPEGPHRVAVSALRSMLRQKQHELRNARGAEARLLAQAEATLTKIGEMTIEIGDIERSLHDLLFLAAQVECPP